MKIVQAVATIVEIKPTVRLRKFRLLLNIVAPPEIHSDNTEVLPSIITRLCPSVCRQTGVISQLLNPPKPPKPPNPLLPRCPNCSARTVPCPSNVNPKIRSNGAVVFATN